LTEAERAAIRALATELPKLWHSPTTTNEQRKEVVRQLVEEAQLTVVGESEQVELTLRWAVTTTIWCDAQSSCRAKERRCRR
jgi:hypothetical protein